MARLSGAVDTNAKRRTRALRAHLQHSPSLHNCQKSAMQCMQGSGDERRAHRVCRTSNTLRTHSTISIFEKRALRIGLAAIAADSPN